MGQTKKRRSANRKLKRPSAAIRVRSRRGPGRLPRVFLVLGGLASTAVLALLGTRGIAAVGHAVFTENPRFMLTEIVVEGTTALSAEDVVRRSDVEIGQYLPRIDLATVRRRLEAVPNISSAEVRREMPATLRIRVRERWPIARLGSGEFVAADGIVLDASQLLRTPEDRGAAEGLPMVVGVPGHPFRPGERLEPEWFGPAAQVLLYARDHRLWEHARVECIDVAARHGLTLYLDEGRTVPMTSDDVERQLRRLEVILDETERKGRKPATVDLTAGRNVPVTFRN